MRLSMLKQSISHVNNLIYKMFDNTKENIRVIIHVRKIWLAVRFNCKLSFMLKNEFSEKIAETDSSFNLFRGECQVNQTIYFEMPFEAILNKCRKLKLIVMMISANGMVPAGFVTFATHPRSHGEHFEQTLQLQRCEDVKSQIKFMHMYESTGRTPLENSAIKQLISRKDNTANENGEVLRSYHYKSSYSLSRDNSNLRRQKSGEPGNQNMLNLSKPATSRKAAVSPRDMVKESHLNVRHNYEEPSTRRMQINRIQEEQVEALDGSINQLSREQLLKEHQQYWVEIIRMEEENGCLKQTNEKLKTQNTALRNENKKVIESYEVYEQKMQQLLVKIEEKDQKIERLQKQVQQQRLMLQQKEQFQKDYSKLIQLLQQQEKSIKEEHESKIKQITGESQQAKRLLQLKLSNLQQELREKVKSLPSDEEISKIQVYSIQLQNQKQQTSALSIQIDDLRNKLAQTEFEVAALKQDNQSLQTKIEEINQQYCAQVSIKQTYAREAEVEKHERTHIQTELINTKRYYESLQGQVNQLIAENEELAAKKEEIILANKGLEEQLLDKDTIIASKNSEIDAYIHQIDRLKQKLANHNDLLHKQTTQKDALSNLAADAESRIRLSQQQYEKAAQQSKIQQSKILHLQQEFEKVQNVNKQLAQQKKSLLSDIEKINSLHQAQKMKKASHDEHALAVHKQQTATLTLKISKMQREHEELLQSNQQLASAMGEAIKKIEDKDKEIIKIKEFTNNALQQHLKNLKELNQLKTKVSLLSKQKEASKIEFQQSKKEYLDKIDQLNSELQFVTEVLKRERQEKSDVDKDVADQLIGQQEKNENLPKEGLSEINEVGVLKEDSFDEVGKAEEGILDIESKVISPSEISEDSRSEVANNRNDKQ